MAETWKARRRRTEKFFSRKISCSDKGMPEKEFLPKLKQKCKIIKTKKLCRSVDNWRRNFWSARATASPSSPSPTPRFQITENMLLFFLRSCRPNKKKRLWLLPKENFTISASLSVNMLGSANCRSLTSRLTKVKNIVNALMSFRPRSQVVRQRSAKSLYASAILAVAFMPGWRNW